MKDKCFLLVMLVSLVSGCSVQQVTMFGSIKPEDEKMTYTIPSKPVFVLKQGDEVIVSISCLHEETLPPFILGADSHLISTDGCIVMPVIGKQKIAGMTEKQAADYIQSTLSNHLIDPVVDVRIVNAVVVVLGEVYNPGTFPIEQPVTLLAALSFAGDLMPSARRDNILVQRIEGDKVKKYRINLLTDDIYNSECFYLQKDDIIYVSPRMNAESKK